MAEQLVSDASSFSVEVSAHSHLVFSRLKQFREVVFWERPELPELAPADTDVFIPLAVNDRMDSIAFKSYRDPDFMWALGIANDTRIPPLEMQPGFLFRVPDFQNLLRTIRQRR